MSILSVDFLIGRAKTGKTHEILNRIAEHEKAGEPSLLIVPSSATFEYEKLLAKLCGGGYMNTVICGFYNFGQKILSESGLDNAFITSQGRAMVIRRALETADLGIFERSARQAGFATVCDDIISNFAACELSPEAVEEAAEKLKDGTVLKAKLSDLAQIYKLTDAYLKEHGQVLRTASETICELIPNSSLCDAHIFIDSPENQGMQTYNMIGAMLSRARSLTIAIRADMQDESDYFSRNNEIYESIHSIIKQKGAQPKITRMTRESRYSSNALEHIEKELFKYRFRKYAGDSSSVEIVSSSSIKSEVDALTAAVLHRAKCGTRFRNMAVVAANPEKYDVAVKRAFANAGIPLFSQCRLKLSSTRAAILINTALKCIASGYRARDVITLLKTGLTDVSRDEAEIFENYVLAYGISGSSFLKSFSIGDIPESCENTRVKVIEPLRQLQSEMSRESVAKRTDALLNYLNILDIEKKLERETEEFEKKSMLVLSKQYAQVWGLITDMLRELKSIMGDSKMSLEDFARVVEEGLCADIIGIIPPGADMLSYSGILSCMPPDIEYLFVIGAQDGELPPVRHDDGIIDDSELAEINDNELSVLLSVEAKSKQDNTNIYTLLTSPTKGIYVSYTESVGDSAQKCEFIIKKLADMFDKKAVSAEAMPYKLYDMDKVAFSMRRLADTGKTDVKSAEYIAWYLNSGKYSSEMKSLVNAIFFNPSPEPLDKAFATELYELETRGSVTRFESFNACPFSHFMKYGLRAKERKEYKEKMVDTGSVCHELIAAFVKHVNNSGINYVELTPDVVSDIVDALSPSIIDAYNDGLFNKNARYAAKKSYIITMVKDTVNAIAEHMRRGSFRFEGSEVSFGEKGDAFPAIRLTLDDGTSIEIHGKIDRIDSFTDSENNRNLRIIDYKCDGKDFDFSEFCAGLNLQLPIYLAAVSAIGNIGCGMFYMPVKKNALTKSDIKGDITEAIIKQFQLVGLSLNQPDIVIAMDRMRSEKGESSVIKEKTKIKGKNCTYSIDKTQLERVKRFALRKAREAAEAIAAGHIEVKPYMLKKESACKYCPYGSVCMFDEEFEGCSYNSIRLMNINSFFGSFDDTV